MFICLPCSGIHRNLGVHISKVRSVSMDALNDDWLDNIENWGNKRANAVWQASVPTGYPMPSASDADNQTPVLERFIRDKYELGRFKKGGGAAGGGQRASGAAAKAKGFAAGGGGGWGDDDDWGSAAPVPGRSPSSGSGRPAPGADRSAAPAAPAAPAPPKLESGAYSTGKMKGFGNPAFDEPAPRAGLGSGLLSGALSGLVTATTSVVSSAAPLVRNSLAHTRPLVGSLASNLT